MPSGLLASLRGIAKMADVTPGAGDLSGWADWIRDLKIFAAEIAEEAEEAEIEFDVAISAAEEEFAEAMAIERALDEIDDDREEWLGGTP